MVKIYRKATATLNPCVRSMSKNIAPPDKASGYTESINEIEDASRKFINKAKVEEAKVTQDLTRLSKPLKGKMEGLEYKLKSQESLTRKIGKELTEQQGKGWNLANIGEKNVNDALRYTMLVEDANYTQAVEKTLRALQKRGYVV